MSASKCIIRDCSKAAILLEGWEKTRSLYCYEHNTCYRCWKPTKWKERLCWPCNELGLKNYREVYDFGAKINK